MIMLDLPADELRALNSRVFEGLEKDLRKATRAKQSTAKAFQARFPEWTLLQNPTKCERALGQLSLMARDTYHHRLTPFTKFVLYHSIVGWANEIEDKLAKGVSPKNGARLEGEHDYWTGAFDLFDLDFLSVDSLAHRVLQGEEKNYVELEQVLPYLELMPPDIANEVVTSFARRHISASLPSEPADRGTDS